MVGRRKEATAQLRQDRGRLRADRRCQSPATLEHGQENMGHISRGWCSCLTKACYSGFGWFETKMDNVQEKPTLQSPAPGPPQPPQQELGRGAAGHVEATAAPRPFSQDDNSVLRREAERIRGHHGHSD